MSDIPPTIEDDGESDYEQEPYVFAGRVTYDEDISKPLDAPDNLVWRPMGTDTDPLTFLPGGHREYLLPLPNRGDSVAGALPPEYGSKWSKPGHLFSKQVDSHLEGPMFKDDRLTLSDEGLNAIRSACKEMQQVVDRGFMAAKQLTDGRLMLLKGQLKELSESEPASDATYESRLHQILAQSWQFALRTDDDLSKSSGEDSPPFPIDSTSDLHHFESEYAGLDKEGWPGSNRYIQEHARIRLKHSRLTKAEENACIGMIATEKTRNDNMGPPLRPAPTSTDEPCWKAPATKKRHRKYDEWAKEVAPLYLVPHINLQDLGTPERLMQFIKNRASVSPIHFLQQDFRATYLGRALRILTGPFSMHEASWLINKEIFTDTCTNPTLRYREYSLKEWKQTRRCELERNSLPVGDMWLGLKAQVITYRFYHRLSLFLLRAAGVKQAKPKADISLFPNLAKDKEDEKTRDIEDVRRYLAETREETGTGHLFSTSLESYLFRFRSEWRGEAAFRGHYEEQFGAAIAHLDYLVTTPEYFHRQIQEAYEQHYAHLFPGLIEGEDMKRELFVDILRDVFRKAFIDLELISYLDSAIAGMDAIIREVNNEHHINVTAFDQGLISETAYEEGLESCAVKRARLFYAVKYRGMIACMQYLSMITNRGIVPASKDMRKYYKRAPRFKEGLGKGNWVSRSGVVRFLPKRGSEGKVMKRTRKLRRTVTNFPALEVELSKEGREAVKTNETIRSIHMLLVEFLGREELISAIGLGKLLRRIGALADKLRSDDKHSRLITKQVDDLIQKMSAIFVTVEQADTIMPYLANPMSSDPDEDLNLAKMREYFIRMEWTHASPRTTKQTLEKLDEFPIENRIPYELISALFRQHKRWLVRQGPADNVQGPDQMAKGLGSRRTASLLRMFWGKLLLYLGTERAIGEGTIGSQTGPMMHDPATDVYVPFVRAWTTLTGRGRTPLGLSNFLNKWSTRDDLYSHIRQPKYDAFRKSLTPLTLERFLEHIRYSPLDDPAIDKEKADEIRRELALIVARIKRYERDEPDRGLSSEFAAEAREEGEKWFLRNASRYSLLPREVKIAINTNTLPMASDEDAMAPVRDLSESEDEEDGQGPRWAEGMGGEVGEEDVDMDSPSEEDPLAGDDSEEEDAEVTDESTREEPVVGNEAGDVTMEDAAEGNDIVEAVDEGLRGMRVGEQPEIEPAPGPAPEPTPEPTPEPAPEPAPAQAPEPAPEADPGTPPHAPESKASTPSPERNKKQGEETLENERYAWLERLDDEVWEEVQKKYGLPEDNNTSARRTKREVPKKERDKYVQMSKAKAAPPEEEPEPPKKGVLKRAVFSTIESIYRPNSGYRSSRTLEHMHVFMNGIGFEPIHGEGSGVRYRYNRERGLLPPDRLIRETFSIHEPHGSWGARYDPPALDAVKKTLQEAGITYELITEFYDERGAN